MYGRYTVGKIRYKVRYQDQMGESRRVHTVSKQKGKNIFHNQNVINSGSKRERQNGTY